MLNITIPSIEKWDEQKQEFVITKETRLSLEHSLVSIKKWESVWEKPFLTTMHKTFEETISYIQCMTVTQNVNPTVYDNITDKDIAAVNDYMDMKMSAYSLPKDIGKKGKKTKNNGIITSETIYYWMIGLNIPMECQKWHFNSLMALINYIDNKNKPPKKMSKKEIMQRNTEINNKRKAALNSTG